MWSGAVTFTSTPLSPKEWTCPPADTRNMSPPPPRQGWDKPLGGLSAWPWTSNQRRPSLLRRLLQNLKQQVAERLGDASVARWCQVEEVEHVLWDDGSVRVDKPLADVQELSLLAQPWQPGAHKPIDRSVLLPEWVGTLASRQQTLEKHSSNLYVIQNTCMITIKSSRIQPWWFYTRIKDKKQTGPTCLWDGTIWAISAACWLGCVHVEYRRVQRNCFYSSHHTYAWLGTGVTHQDDDLRFWEARPQQLSDGKNSSCHLFRRVLVIICSYPQHHHLDKTTHTLVNMLWAPLPHLLMMPMQRMQVCTYLNTNTGVTKGNGQLTCPKDRGSCNSWGKTSIKHIN